MCPASKSVCHKLCKDLQFLLALTHHWKNLSIDFVTGLPLSTNQKSNNYDSIFVIVNCLTKIVNYKLVKVIINAPRLVKIIINVVMQYYGLPDCIISECRAIFTSKFMSSLCYFFSIKKQLSTAFHLQTDGQTKQQNSMIETYFCAFMNLEQNDGAWFLLMARFAYNNSKNASMDHILFELNCSYHLWVSFKDKCNALSRSFSVNRLATELRELINIYR